jgi:hypothetical protein
MDTAEKRDKFVVIDFTEPMTESNCDLLITKTLHTPEN